MCSLSDELVTGDGRTITVSDIVDLYRKNISLLVPIAGEIKSYGKEHHSLVVRYSATNYEATESIKSSKVYYMKMNQNIVESVPCVSDLIENTELASATSRNGRYLARLRTDKESDKQILQIYYGNRLLRTIDISSIEAHGNINTDSQFAGFDTCNSLSWCPSGDQDKLLYVCQPKVSRSSTFFSNSGCSTLLSDSETNHGSQRANQEIVDKKFDQREDWGECLDGIEHTMIGIIDVANDFKVTIFDADCFSQGSPQWVDNGTKIISTAYQETPRRLGPIYCNNRESFIIIHDLKNGSSPYVILSDPILSYHSHRVSNSGDKIIFLSNPKFGAHKQPVRLNLYDLTDGSHRLLTAELFIQDLPKFCFTTDDKQIILTTHDHLYQYLCLYRLKDAKLVKIKFPTTAVSILDFKKDIILASGSEINSTPTVFVAKLNTSDIDDVIAWHQIEECTHLHDIEYESHKIPTQDQTSFVSSILVRPNLREHSGLPTVVVVHGGPHSAFLQTYLPICVFYARLGLKTLLINYRGSTGVDGEYINKLSGNVGTMDVDDCLHVLRHLVRRGLVDPSKLVIQGGSHGGFLAAHLTCQQEFQFTSAIMRNPVIDISTLFSTSDIPDWALSVALGHKEYRPDVMPTKEELTRMFECSPISKYKDAYVPTMMHLGCKDRRVNMYQGERWIDLLRSRGIETSCKVYPDKHDLAKPEVAADSTVNSAIWILKHL